MNLALNIIFWILLGLTSSLIEGLPIVRNPNSGMWVLVFGLIPLLSFFGKMPLFSVSGFKKFTSKNWSRMILLIGINLCIALVIKSFAHLSYTTVLAIVVMGIQSHFSSVQKDLGQAGNIL